MSFFILDEKKKKKRTARLGKKTHINTHIHTEIKH